MRRFKAALMEALFTRTLRFTRDDGSAFPDWEETRLSDLAGRVTERNKKLAFTRVLTNSAVQGVIDQADYFEREIINEANIGGYVVCRLGDFVYNPRMSETAPVGPISRNDLGDGVMSPLYTVFRFHESATNFFAQYFQSTLWHEYLKSVANTGVRHDRLSLTVDAFMSLPIPLADPDEQARIAAALDVMDRRIDLASREIDILGRFKAGLLQQMFV